MFLHSQIQHASPWATLLRPVKAGLRPATAVSATGNSFCCNRRRSLLPPVAAVATTDDGGVATADDGGAAATGDGYCYDRGQLLLRPATGEALAELLRPAAEVATTGERRCYLQPLELLALSAGVATTGERRCYHRPPELLRPASGDATTFP